MMVSDIRTVSGRMTGRVLRMFGVQYTRRFLKPLSWLAGIAGVAQVIWYVDHMKAAVLTMRLGYGDVAIWLILTILAKPTC